MKIRLYTIRVMMSVIMIMHQIWMDGVLRPSDGRYDIGAYEFGIGNSYNSPPIVNAGVDTIVALPVNSIEINGSAIDIDGQIKIINWSQISGPIGSIMNNVNSLTISISNLIMGVYIFQLTVEDDKGAISDDIVTVEVLSENSSELKIPKIITPDGNGINDFWEIENYEALSGCQVMIFNRNGLKVFESNDYQNDWNATYKGQVLPDGAYYYIIQCKDDNMPITGGVRIITKH